MILLCLDFEASGSGAGGYPIEVAITVVATGEAYALFPKQHRAGPDARRNAEILRQLAG